MDKELSINGREYRIKQYKFTERSELLWRLTKMLGEAGASLLNGVLGEGDLLDQDIDLGGILRGFLGQIDPREHTEFIKQTIQNLTVSPKKINIDQDKTGDEFENYFSDYFSDHLPLFIEIIRHNLMSAVSEDIKKKLSTFASIIPTLSGQDKAESMPA